MKHITLLAVLLTLLCTHTHARAAEMEKAYFAAGCFWCVEAIYERVPGVTSVVSGYAGGTKENPTYEEVGRGTTGHTETVEITFDPSRVSFAELLTWFWKSHDPTEGRGVAPDFGTQYRSALFYTNDAQKDAIVQSKAEWRKRVKKPIATEIAPLSKFYPAEDYHQDFVRLNPDHPYVRKVSLPRVKETGVP